MLEPSLEISRHRLSRVIAAHLIVDRFDMITVRRIQIGEGEGELFQRMRLTSLDESPSAFASTYESALNRSDENWGEQADSTARGSDRATFIAFSGDSPLGIAALYRDMERMDVGEVLQVWVAPEYRSKGVAADIMTLFPGGLERMASERLSAPSRKETRELLDSTENMASSLRRELHSMALMIRF